MDEIFIKDINASSLPDRLKELAIYTATKKLDKNMCMYLNSEKSLMMIEKMKRVAEDFKVLEIPTDVYCYIFYDIMRNFCGRDELAYNKLLAKTFFSEDFYRQVSSLETSNSEFVSCIRSISPKVFELIELMQTKQSLLVLKKYQEIIDLCNRMGISPGLSDEEIRLELEKRFSKYSAECNPQRYKRNLKTPKYKEGYSPIPYNPTDCILVSNLSDLMLMIQKSLHTKMFEYYEETKCICRQYNADLNIYHLGDITVIAYKDDDYPNMALKAGNLTITWKDRDFWAIINDDNIDFIEGEDINYFIDNPGNSEVFKVVSLALKDLPFNSITKKVILAPEEYLDEAIYKSLTENGNVSLDIPARVRLESLGIDLNNITNKLMSGDYQFYFKDPVLVDELNIKDLNEFTHLGLIKLKTDATSRKRCIASIKTAYKKDPKKPEKAPDKPKVSYRKTKNPAPRWWLPYRED